MASVDSTSDERTVNNTMRHQYRVLSDAEKANMAKIKDMGLAFHAFVDGVGNSREISIAKTKIEEAVMWAVKHITAALLVGVFLAAAVHGSFAADAAAPPATFTLGPIASWALPFVLAVFIGVIRFAVRDVAALAAKYLHFKIADADQARAADYLAMLAAKALGKAGDNLATVSFSDHHPVVDAIVSQALGEIPGMIAKAGWTPQRLTDETIAALGRLQAQMTAAAPAKAA
jgi:hypothetical protein